jgi:uncharacterized protein (DUF1800 family)
MELHTLGVTTTDGLYTPADVNELAKILSGWSTSKQGNLSRYRIYAGTSNGIIQRQDYEFVFKSNNHDPNAKIFLDIQFPAGVGQEEGELALDMLANHSQTAKFICEKMAKTFVSDTPRQKTISNCKSKFLKYRDAPDQIARALDALIGSDEFEDEDNMRAKFKDNQEYMFGLGRLLSVNAIGTTQPGGFLGGTVFGEAIERTGQGLFNKAPPTGYHEDADSWITTNAVLNRFREGNTLLRSGYTSYLGAKSTAVLVADLNNAGLTTSGEVLATVFKLMLGGEYDLKHMEMGYWILHPGGEVFDLNELQTRTKLMNLISRIAQLPEYNLH